MSEELKAWDRVQLARSTERPTSLEFIGGNLSAQYLINSWNYMETVLLETMVLWLADLQP
ncbi:MAG: Acetyl co-enzyme carboxylase carboxyltransferase alpha subunit [Lachnospiraceae bacterium]|nr:Acetyl co-enzyme carboxylase carboxyltransferase alpha subunit [Lachnospiraceae bacterium]